ncbi:MAG: UvrD-helicase domain-containing protein, partial [Chloroflexi bacterium]|nr:UvrD-helicase domain-containing protein [Chloroflexota bacterium]
MTTPIEADASARRAIREQLGRSLIVEAGAGTGKTHSLVDRIESLIVSGKGTIDQIVAITFTRAAAAELRERVRARLEGKAGDARTGTSARERLERALAGLDRAAIQTIDSFALSLVRERNLEARVPPLIQPLDEIEAALAFEERWRAWLDRELDGGRLDEPLARVVRLGFNGPLARLQEVARRFHENYRMLEGARFRAEGRLVRTAAQSVVRVERDLVEVLRHADGSAAPVLASRLAYAVGLARRLREAGVESE